MDIFVFFMAGFNEMANASRETMAIGKFSIGVEYCHELVEHEVSGLVIKNEPG